MPSTEDSERHEPETWTRAFAERRYADAIRLLTEDLAKEEDPEKRLVIKSIVGYIKFEENVQAGIAYFEQLIEESPEAYQPYEWLAWSYYWRGLNDNALAALGRGLQAAKQKAPLYNIQAECLVALGRDPEAIVAANKAIDCDPSEPSGYLTLSKIFERTNDINNARNSYKRGLTATSGSETILRAYATFLSEKGMKEEAVLRYTELVAKQPNSAQYLTLLGNAYLNAGLNNRALVTYKKANELADGKQGWIHGNIGNLYKNQGFYADAIVELKEALKLEPDSQYAHERLAQAQRLESDEDQKLTALLQRARAERADARAAPLASGA